jgi:4-amino-4-deoxy-L-arabinose transferase-like glycosyltransferase
MMAGIVYALCTLAALLCSWLLLKAYRRSRYKLLLWGGLCFLGLTLHPNEGQPFFYVVRFLSFALILIAIADKNWKRTPRD